MTILEEIRNGFAYIENMKFRQIGTDREDRFWIFRREEEYGVGLEVRSNLSFSEQFTTARLYTETVSLYQIKKIRLLLLTNTEERLRNEFAAVCAQFVDAGEKGRSRKEIVSSPKDWWDRWRSLLGNSLREMTPYAVLGELLVYSRLLRADIKPVIWKASGKSSHDIETERSDYEVKSTLTRYGATITISGQHQLECSTGKTLKIMFCRFEGVDFDGMSINSVLRECANSGADASYLEKELSRLGYKNGSTAREEQFVLHDQILVYDVDGSFPKITPSLFAGGVMPAGVIRLSYQIDLTALRSEPITKYLDDIKAGTTS
jgi:hypothetical protein